MQKQPASPATSTEELVAAARGGDTQALEQLRARGFFSRTALSHAQRRLWFLDRLQPGDPSYNMPGALLLEGELDEKALEAAFRYLIGRHEILRTVFEAEDGEPVQRILDSAEASGWKLHKVDLEGHEHPMREAEALVRREHAVRFNLSHGPLLRTTLARLGGGRHLLVFNLHHIVFDEWSFDVLSRELDLAYRAFASGGRPGLPPLASQYRDYAAEQNRRLGEGGLREEEAWWTRTLEGLEGPTELPSDFRRSPDSFGRAATLRREISGDMLQELRTYAREKGASLYAVLMSAFQAVLYRYTGSEDLVTGMPVAGRTGAGQEEQIGFYINTLPLRSRIPGGRTFAELLAETGAGIREALARQDYPFDLMVENLGLPRAPGRNPLISAVFNFLQAGDGEEISLGDLRCEPFRQEQATAKFDFVLQATEKPRQLVFNLSWQPDLYEESKITGFFRHFRNILRAALRDDGRPLEHLPMLDPEEEKRLTREEFPAAVPTDETVTRLFDRLAGERPARTALLLAGSDASLRQEEELSYADIKRRSDRLARRLRDRYDIKKGEVVLCCLGRTAQVFPLMLGVMKAGGVFLPVDAALPETRIAYMADDASAHIVLTTAGLADKVRRMLPGARVLTAEEAFAPGDTDSPRADRREIEEGALHPAPADPAYLIYTSGSTGKPKGVLVAHRSLMSMATGYARHPDIPFPREARGLQFSTIGFDIFFLETLPCFIHGGSVLVCGEHLRYHPEALVEAVARYGVDYMLLTPNVIRSFERRPLPGVSLLASGADKADPGDLLHYLRQGIPTMNWYGPTEITVGCTSHRVSAEEDYERRSMPIGRPIPGVQQVILDRWGNLLPEGIPGELCIRGGHVALGYLNRPELTAEKFPEDPFGGGRMYRSGDLALRRFDGEFAFAGRMDAQVKIGAYRIEPGEIESVLRSHPGVGEAAVFPLNSERGEQVLAAQVECGGGVLTPPELRQWLMKKLPRYMVPVHIGVLERIPRMPNGKIDRAALERLVREESATEAKADAFGGPAAELVARLFRRILDLEAVEGGTHFFEAGGQSLKAARLSALLLKEGGVRVGIGDIFAHPTAGELAALVAQRDPAAFLPIAPRPGRDRYPLSSAQYRLWMMDRMEAAGDAYRIGSAMEIRGTLDLQALRRACEDLFRRHASLRTVFGEAGGEPTQRVVDAMELPLEIWDLAGEDDPEAALAGRLEEAGRRTFDLRQGPPCRLAVARTAADRHILLVQMHHIIGDEWSLEVFFGDLLALYRSHAGGQAPELPPLPLQYHDYALWEKEQAEAGAFAEAGRYWKELLGGELPVLDLPADKPRPALKTYRGDHRSFTLPAELAGRLRELASENGGTLFALMLASYRVLLHRYSGQEDLIIGTPAANRPHPDLERQIGFFINMLPLRRSVDPSDGFREELAREIRGLQRALDRQAYPFHRLVEELDLRRDPSRSPLFDAGISYGEQAEVQGDLPGLEVSPYPLSDGSSRLDMIWYLNLRREGELRMLCEFNTDLFSVARIESFFSAWRQLLHEISLNPERPVGSLPLLDGEGRQQIIHGWGMGARPGLAGETLPELFARAAERYPGRPAVADLKGTLTYAELDRRSVRLAHLLRKDYGVGVGGRVAALFGKDPQMAVAWLAALKAGAAYVPLDPAAPAARQRFMLEDTGASVLLAGSRQAADSLAGNVPVLPLDELRENGRLEGMEETSPLAPPAITGDDPANIIYTSGSSGTPKGTLVPHRGIIRMAAQANFMEWGPHHRILQTGSPAFDASTMEVWSALLNGGCLCFPQAEDLLDAARLKVTLEKLGVNAAIFPTGLFNQLAESDPTLFETLDYLMLGGDRMSPRHAAMVLRHGPGLRLLNGYGPTENTVITTWHHVKEEPAGEIPIGRPVSHTSVYILDEEGQPLPPGIPGELCTGGEGVAVGYLGREELTREVFRPDPFLPGGTMYRTGDACSWSEDGTVRFHGRMDDQVKVNGYRVEPGEIRNRLQQHEGVRQCHVHYRAGDGTPAGGGQLVAYYTGIEVDAGPLRKWLAATLPDFMIPAAFVRLEALPLNAGGKVDTGALPAPESVAEEAPGAEPLGEKETLLHGVWTEILGRARIGREENWFELGGDSIKAIRCVNRLAAEGWELSVADLFRRPDIARLAEELRPLADAETAPADAGDIPLNAIQRWFFRSYEEGPTHFNQALSLGSGAPMDAEALDGALRCVVERHGALRSVFRREEGRWRQQVRPPEEAGFALEIADFSGDTHPKQAAEAHAARLQRSFRLEEGPLFRAVLYRLGVEEHLVLLAHHLVVDAVSWHILTGELQTLYEGIRLGNEPALPPAPSLRSWNAWLQRFAGEEAAASADAWKELLGGEAELSFLKPHRPHTYGSCRRITVELDEANTALLQGEVHGIYNTNVEDFLLAALGRAWSGSGGGRLTLMLEGHGRDRLPGAPDANRTVGWFTSRYPFALPLARGGEGEDLKAVKDALRRVPDHGLSWGALAEIAGQLPGAEPAVSFNYLGQFGESGDASGTNAGAAAKQAARPANGASLRLSAFDTGPSVDPGLARRQVVDLTALVRDGRLRVEALYHPGLAGEVELRRGLENMMEELTALIGHCAGATRRERTATDFSDRQLSGEDLDSIIDLFS